MDGRARGACAWVACAVVWSVGLQTALATEVAAAQASDVSAAEKATAMPPREDAVRVDLGVTTPALGALGIAGAAGGTTGAGLGALGGSAPSVEAALEIHLSGALWLVMQAAGAYTTLSASNQTSRAWSVQGDAGVRVETPVFRWLEGGGYFLVGGTAADYRAEGYAAEATSVRATAGASAHFRPTDFFGVRTSLDVLSGGHTFMSANDQDASSTFLALTAVPHIDLTFSF